MKNDYKNMIENSRVYDVAIKTPLDYARNLSERVNNRVWLKREDLQPVFSFKIRGAFNKISGLPKEQLEKGVIAASAGNHAQGVALSAQKLGIEATIVMPKTTPQIKIDAVQSYGAKVVLHGDSYSDAAERAKQLIEEKKLTFIHPFDDPEVIAGQGTVGKEILDQHVGNLDAVFVCIGGGGLASGIAAYIKSVKPEVKIIGVEPDDSDAMDRSIKADERVVLEDVGIFADGVAVKQVGEETFNLCKKYLDDIVCVSTDEICAAIKDVFEDTRTVLEPAGALGVAGVKKYIAENDWQGKDIAVTASGANMNFDRLRHVSERTEFAERREGILAVTIPEKPGSFKAFCKIIGNHNITEFNYRYADNKEAHIYAGVQIKNAEELEELIQRLRDKGYQTLDLTDNEVAKLHVRHLVGGHAPHAKDERVYRFQFPERPGALMNFLNKLGDNWNISLFHYRNHGADFGRILCGLQVPESDMKTLDTFLQDLGYPHIDESDNLAYQLFLG